MGVPAGLSLLAVLLASYIKGVIGFGFPTIATPFLALFVDLRTAVVVLILPNIVFDAIQTVRKPGLLLTLRCHAILYICGIAGTFLGTQVLVWVSSKKLLLILPGNGAGARRVLAGPQDPRPGGPGRVQSGGARRPGAPGGLARHPLHPVGGFPYA